MTLGTHWKDTALIHPCSTCSVQVTDSVLSHYIKGTAYNDLLDSMNRCSIFLFALMIPNVIILKVHQHNHVLKTTK